MSKPCPTCGKPRWVLKTGAVRSYCRECALERAREYQKEYCQRPEVKAKRKEYQKEYCQRPEVKEKLKKRWRDYHQAHSVDNFAKKCAELGFSEETTKALVLDGEVLDKRLAELKASKEEKPLRKRPIKSTNSTVKE